MGLHCAATLLLVGDDVSVDADGAGLAAAYGPWVEGVDVVGELQHLADLHRGERVLVTLTARDLAGVLTHLGRADDERDGTDRVRVEVGDDGWAVVPWDLG
ncbi:hypothetical protein GCM10023168_09340 [Fodinibacter luteus]|uniref:Uncharacterized protein n=1 Tax=Fodinibacter luteus TaxID=552064 RepID=A0ABP8K4I8_9MICO